MFLKWCYNSSCIKIIVYSHCYSLFFCEILLVYLVLQNLVLFLYLFARKDAKSLPQLWQYCRSEFLRIRKELKSSNTEQSSRNVTVIHLLFKISQFWWCGGGLLFIQNDSFRIRMWLSISFWIRNLVKIWPLESEHFDPQHWGWGRTNF